MRSIAHREVNYSSVPVISSGNMESSTSLSSFCSSLPMNAQYQDHVCVYARILQQSELDTFESGAQTGLSGHELGGVCDVTGMHVAPWWFDDKIIR